MWSRCAPVASLLGLHVYRRVVALRLASCCLVTCWLRSAPVPVALSVRCGWVSRVESLSQKQARRIALAAQGFLDPRHTTPTMRTFARTLERTGVLQVDSVNVLQRAHYMPLFSRMGAYDPALLTRAAEKKPRRLVEYWAHVQALMPVELWPVMQHRMASYRALKGKWWQDVDDDLAQRLLAEVSARGASTARGLDDGAPRDKKHWGWNWSEAKKALDFLYMCGDVAVAGRNSQFEVDLRRTRAGDPGRGPGPPDADARGGRPRARTPGGGVPRGRHGPVPGRLLPDEGRGR